MNALKIDDEVYRKAKLKAVKDGQPLKAVIEQLLRDWLKLSTR